jgi:hypothetical protein
VPVNVKFEVEPLQMGLVAVTDAVIDVETTVTTIFSGVLQPFKEIWVKVIVTPAGQVEPREKLVGPNETLPMAGIDGVTPLPPVDVVQLSVAPTAPETLNVLLSPAHNDVVDGIGTAGAEFMVIVPVAFTDPQPPDKATLYANGLPVVEVGVPLIVIVPAVAFPLKVATSPTGKFTAPIPVAPVVLNTIFGLSAWFEQIVALGAGLLAVIVAPTVKVPTAGGLEQEGVFVVLTTTE